MKKYALPATALALVLALPAFALDLYVSTAGSAANDGSDWDHALLSISNAIERVAADPAGGTVHVAGGIYRSSQGHFAAGTAFTCVNGVAVVGSADPANPTIITGDLTLNDTWEGGSAQWVSGALQLPPENGYIRPVAQNPTNNDKFLSIVAATNCVFSNLTVHGFKAHGIAIDWADGVRFENCRFVGIGHSEAHPQARALTLANGPCVVTNCLFAGCNGGLSLSAADAVAFVVADTCFRSCVNLGAYSGLYVTGVIVSGKATVHFSGCVFDHLKSGTQNISFKGSEGQSSFTNCVVSNCVVTVSNGSSGNIYTSGMSLSLTGCRLASNTLTASGPPSYCHAACLCGPSGSPTFALRDCLFVGNLVEQTAGGGGGYAIASVAAIVNFGRFEVANCAFVGNVARGITSRPLPCTFGGWRDQKSWFANCVFRGNDALLNGERKPEMKGVGLGGTGSPMFLNTVLWHEAADYIPFDFASGSYTGRLGIASCVVKGDTPVASSGSGFRYDVLDADPLFAAQDAVSGILSTPKFTARSPAVARRGAVKVCQATDGKLYFLDTHKTPNVWRKLAPISETSSLSLAKGAAIGLDVDGPAIPDIFGNARAPRAPIGPYALCPSPVTRVLVH